MEKKRFSALHRDVVERGLCTGCGTCGGVCRHGAIQFDFELEEPSLTASCRGCGLCYAACPGQDIPLAKLEKKFLGESRTRENEYLGVYKSLLQGYAKDLKIRLLGASGGLTTALLLFALDQGMINGAIITGMDHEKPWRPRPILARTREELLDGAKSKYVISPNNVALRELEKLDRVAVVGLPCHVHGIRKIQSSRNLSNLGNRIAYVFGLYCGSNYSHEVTEHLIQEYSDVDLAEIERLEYRGGEHAQDVTLFTRGGNIVTITNAERRMVFQCTVKDRCRMCCDWTAELSDLSFGDLFDPRVRGEARKIPNWNSVIVRTERGSELIREARRCGVIDVSLVEENALYWNLGFELKKHGAVLALKERKRYGWPVPDYHYDFMWEAKRKAPYALPEG